MTAEDVYVILKKKIASIKGVTQEELNEAIKKYLDENGITVQNVDGGTFDDWSET